MPEEEALTEQPATYTPSGEPAQPSPAEPPMGLRLGTLQERRLRAWPKDRVRPKSVALGVISLLAEVDALRSERNAFRDLSGRHLDRLRDLEEIDKEHAECPSHLTVLSEQRDRLTAERDDARAAIMALVRHSPFYEVITDVEAGIVEVGACQFCQEIGQHTSDCPWMAVEAIAAGKPAIPTPLMIAALYEADAALTAVFNSHEVKSDLMLQVDRAIRRCRAAGTNLPWPGEARDD